MYFISNDHVVVAFSSVNNPEERKPPFICYPVPINPIDLMYKTINYSLYWKKAPLYIYNKYIYR